jgi:hypothetical protein
MFPFLIDFILERELNTAATDLPGIDKHNRNLIRRKCLFPDDVVNNRLRFVILGSLKPVYKLFYLNFEIISVTELAELGVIRLLMTLLLFQIWSLLTNYMNPVYF